MAADAPALVPAALAGLSLAQLGDMVLAPHSVTRWAWFADHPIYTLWQRNRGIEAEGSGDEMAWTGEGALLTRPVG